MRPVGTRQFLMGHMSHSQAYGVRVGKSSVSICFGVRLDQLKPFNSSQIAAWLKKELLIPRL